MIESPYPNITWQTPIESVPPEHMQVCVDILCALANSMRPSLDQQLTAVGIEQPPSLTMRCMEFTRKKGIFPDCEPAAAV